GVTSSRSPARPPVQVPTLSVDFNQGQTTQNGESPTLASGLPADLSVALDFSAPPPAARTATAPPGQVASSALLPPQDAHVPEMVHDPELDEAVIAFANADFDQCERCLLDLIQSGADRHDHPDTWM